MELLKHSSLGLRSIISQREYVYIYSSWTVHSDTLVLLFLGTGHSLPWSFEKLELRFCSLQPTLLFLLMSLLWQSDSLPIPWALWKSGALLKPSPVLAATAPTTVWPCPLLLICLFLCGWSSECGSFCTNHFFNMPAFVSGLTPAPFLPSLLGQVYKKAFIILLILFVFFCFFLIFLLSFHWHSRFSPLLPSVFLSTNGCLTPCYQMLYL